MNFSNDDFARAAESLTFQEMVDRNRARLIEGLSDSEITKVASGLQELPITQEQAEVADRMGRVLARSMSKEAQGGVGQVGKAVLEAGKKGLSGIGKALTGGHYKSLVEKPSGSFLGMFGPGPSKMPKGLAGHKAAIGAAWKKDPVGTAKTLGKQVAIPLGVAGAGIYGTSKVLGGKKEQQ